MFSARRSLDRTGPNLRQNKGVAALADLFAVAVFVIIGRASHHESLSSTGLLTTAWPFFIGVGGGYVASALTDWPAADLRTGAVIAAKTVIIGLLLRYGVQHNGTPFAFIVVAAVFLGAFILGWRLAARTRR